MPQAALDVRVQIRALTCHAEGNGWRRTEPYLWAIYFTLDGHGLRLTESFELQGKAQFQFSEGSHGNLQVPYVQAGQRVPIPVSIGHFETQLQSIPVPFFNYEIPGMLGIILVLMEKENVSGAGAEAGHKALNENVVQAVDAALKEFDVKAIDVENIQASIKAYFSEKVYAFVHDIEEAVTQAIVQSQNFLQNIWSFIDKDDLIGFVVWDVNQNELQNLQEPFLLHHRWNTAKLGDWEIEGKIWVNRPSIPPLEVPIE